jgi:carbonic anhydrase
VSSPPADGTSGIGQAQSPIDIPWPISNEPPLHEITLRYDDTAEHLVHKAHTIEAEYDEGSSVVFDGRPYQLEQFHFHTPSEHLVAGQRFPIELHLVHHDSEGRALVVGILFETGPHSAFLARILADAPSAIGRVDRDRPLNVGTLFPQDSHFYAYVGSFTTPPFSEGVQWLILDQHPRASAEQVVRLLVLEGGNARDAQPRHGRTVVRD